MEVEYEHEPRDVEAWWLHHCKRSSPHRLSYWLSVLLIGGAGAWLGTQIGLTPTSRIILGLCGLLAGWGLAAASTRLWIHATVVASAKGHAAQQQFGRHRLTLRPEGVFEQGPSASHSHNWSAVEGLVETADHLFLPVGGGYAYVVPKRALPPESAAAFRTSVASHMEEEGRRRTRG